MLRYADALSDPLRHRYGRLPSRPDLSYTRDLSWLRARCTQVGDQVGWRLHLAAWQQIGLVALTARAAGTDEIPLAGPNPITDDTIAAMADILDALARGERRLAVDEQGEPRLF